MEENLLESQEQNQGGSEPDAQVSDNSQPMQQDEKLVQETNIAGKSNSDPANLILGKFKSIDDLTKAYQNLEKHQGMQSAELGQLRQNSVMLSNINKAWQKQNDIMLAKNELQAVSEKYNTPEYFQDPSFRELFKEAYLALGKNLDADRLVNLIEGYVSSRIFSLEKSNSAKAETTGALNSISFEKNSKSSITPPKKRLDEMTQEEVNELIDRLI